MTDATLERRALLRIDLFKAMLQANYPPPAAADATAAFTHAPGQRVFDSVTGEEAIVVTSHAVAVVAPAAQPQLD